MALCASPTTVNSNLTIELNAWKMLSREHKAHVTKVLNASSSSVICLVVEYPLVLFVALVSFVTLVHLTLAV